MLDRDEEDAGAILEQLASAGLVEFASSLGPSTLAVEFATLLDAGAPSGKRLSEWLLAQAEVAEVYADDATLEMAVRKELEQAARREPAPSPAPTILLTPLVRTEYGHWSSEVDLDLGVGDTLRASVFFDEIDGRVPRELFDDLEAVVRSMPRFWPEIACALVAAHSGVRDVFVLHQVLDSVALHFSMDERPKWTLQISFDLPDEGDVSYLAEIAHGRVLSIVGAD